MQTIQTVKPFGDIFTSQNNLDIMGTLSTNNATVLMLKHSLGDGLVVSTQLHPSGYEMVTINGGLSDVRQARALASLNMSPADQLAIATGLRDEEHLSAVFAKTLGVKPAAGSGVMKSTLKITHTHVAQMANDFIAPYSIASKYRRNAVALVQSLFAELFQSIGNDKSTYYSIQTPITHFFAPISIEDDLADPFAAALVLDRVSKSPFGRFDFDAKAVESIKRSEGRHISLGSLVEAITMGAQSLVTSFGNNSDYQGMVIVGLQIVSDVIHRRVDVPPSFNNHPIISTLRTNITFHNLTLDEQQGGQGVTFDGQTTSRVRDMMALTRDVTNGAVPDDLLERKAALVGGPLDSNIYLDKLSEFINTYMDLSNVRDFAGFFGITQFTANDDTNTVSAIHIHMDRSFPLVAPVFTGLQMEFRANGRPNRVATLTRPVLEYSIPVLPDTEMVDTISEQIMNMDKAEVAAMISNYTDDDASDDFTLGGMLMPLPGTAVNLITNMNELDHSSYVDFANVKSGDAIQVPYLVQLFASALAHEFTFAPNSPIEYKRKAELNAPLRTAQSQIPDVISYDKNEIVTDNPLHILVATTLNEAMPKHKFTINKPQVDLKTLIGAEFIMDVDQQTRDKLKTNPVHRFVVPSIPKKRNDRRAELGRVKSKIAKAVTLRDKVIVEDRFSLGDAKALAELEVDIADDAKMPVVYYRSRYVSTGTGENVNNVVMAPLDLHQIFGYYDEMYVSSIISYVSFDDQLNSLLDAIQDLGVVFPNAGNKAHDRLGDVIHAIAGSYIRVGIARSDVIGIQANNKFQQNEFATMYGIALFVDLAERMNLITKITGVRLLAAVDNMEQAQFERVSANVMGLIAKRHTGVK